MMRILNAVVVLALLLGSGVAVPAIALGEVIVSINAPAEVTSGSNFTATVNITPVVDFDATNYDVSFNATVLRLDNVTSGNIGGTSIPIDIWNEISVGKFTIVQNVPELTGVNGTGYLAVLHFSVLGSSGQSSNISLSDGVLSSNLAQEIPATWVGDSVTIPPVVQLVSIAVTPVNPSIALGLTKQFTATGRYADNSTANITSAVTWASANTSVATISAAGLASSVAVGTTTITATSGNISGNTTLTVTAATLVSIAVTPPSPSIALGLTQQFTATGRYTNNSTANITDTANWTSSNITVAEINPTGMAFSNAQGTTTITATSANISGNTTLMVTATSLVSIAVTPTAPSIALGLTRQFTATGRYADNSTANITGAVTWTSSNTTVATINAAGLATSVAVGTTTITATSGAISGNTTLTVTIATTVEINNGNRITLNVGANITGSSTGGIPIDVKNISTTAQGLAAFDFILNWNPAVIRVDLVRRSTVASDLGWSFTIGAITNNVTSGVGTVNFVGTTTQTPYSKADLTLAYLGITAVGSLGDNTTLTVTITNLTDNMFNEITPRTPVNAPVMIGISLVAETSTSQTKDSDGVVVVGVNIDRIKNPSDNSTASITGGIGSYAATVTAVPGGGIELLNVRGVSPFDTVTFNPATGAFAVATVSSPPQAANTTVAKVVPRLIGNGLTSYNLIVAFNSIRAAGQPGLNVSEEHTNSITLRRGDADKNGAISIVDSLAIKQYLVGQLTLTQINPLNASSPKHDGVDGDKISVVDALAIEQYLVGQINAYFE